MPRVKRAVTAKKKRRTVLTRAKGYYGNKSRSVRAANEQVMKSGQYAFRDRRARKRDLRKLWIARINAAARLNGLTYSRLVFGLKPAGDSGGYLQRYPINVAVPDPDSMFVEFASTAGQSRIIRWRSRNRAKRWSFSGR